MNKQRKSSTQKISFTLIQIAILIFSTNPISAQEINPMVVGNNVWFSNPSNQVWDLTAASGVGSLRIGGNGYDRNIPSNTELLNWVNRIQGMGAEPILQVPQGGPEADYSLQNAIDIAVGLVTFFNLESNGNIEPIKYWSIGNEPWLYYDRKYGENSIAPIVEAYFKPIAAAMKEVDPTIKIFGPDFAYYIEPAINALYGGTNDISGLIPGKDYYYSDGISWHSYPQDESIKLSTQGVEQFRQSIVKSKARVDFANNLNNRTGNDALEWGIGEFNAKNGPFVHTWDNGQMFAGIYNYCMKYSATYCTTWSMFENGGNRLGTDYSFIDGNMTPRPTYRHMQMIAHNFHGEYADGTTTDNDLLIFGSKWSDSVSVMIVNRSDKPKSYSLSLSTTKAGSEGIQLTIDADSIFSYSDIISGSATQTLVFGNDEIVKIQYTIDHFLNELPPSESKVVKTNKIPTAPSNIKADSIAFDFLSISWQKGAIEDTVSGYIVERKLSESSNFELLGISLDTSFTDTKVTFETDYTYRIQAYSTAGKSLFSSNFDITTSSPPARVPYNGPHLIPGKIEVENFDDNPGGIGYFDSDDINEGGAYRNTGVDIENSSDTGGGYNIGYIESGEWLEFSLEDVTPGNYDINFRLASNAEGSGKIAKVLLNGNTLGQVSPTFTGGWQTWVTKTVSNVNVEEVEDPILRLQFTGQEFNVNWIEFVEHIGTYNNEEQLIPNEYKLFNNFPNPFNPSTLIKYSIPTNSEVTLEVFNMIGNKVATLLMDTPTSAGTHSIQFNASDLSSGAYFYRLKTNNILLTKKMLLIK